MASGIVNAGGSAGQFIFAPMVQFMTNLRGYYASFILLAVWALLSILPARILCRPKISSPLKAECPSSSPLPDRALTDSMTLKQQLRAALADTSYLFLIAGFFTCGFHVAFLTTHLPGEASLCGHSAAVAAAGLSLIGLCNIGGSLGAGFLGKFIRMKSILAGVYAARALLIFLYLWSDKSESVFYAFAVSIGFTWLATVPPTAGIISKLFGVRYFATLFGIAFLTHQMGAFLGAWLGGVAMQQSNSYLWVWYLDIGLALLAALVNLFIKEKAPPRPKAQRQSLASLPGQQ
jgi:predicted MFS family arabinose efflux permease